ncbi:MAG: hypothetical protein ACTSQ7_16385 [Alphaproteobacteria bacterium]
MFTHTFWEQAMNLGGGSTGTAPTWEAETSARATSRDPEGAKLALANPALNRAVGFTSLLIGVASGMILGLWSFGGPIPVPEGIGDYGDLPRRFLRLGHIAFFGLGLINLAIAGHWRRLDLGRPAAQRVLRLMNLGNLGLPPVLLAAAWQPTLLYLMPIPVVCVFTALALCAVGSWRSCVAASFGTGEGSG